MKINAELQKLTAEELNAKLLEFRTEQFKLRMKKANGTLDKQHAVKVLRKNIARVKTYLTKKVGMSHDE